MKKTAGITILAASLLLVFAMGQTNVGRDAGDGEETHGVGVLRFGDIPQETPMYTAWGVDVAIRGVVDTANNASNIATEAYTTASNTLAAVVDAQRSAAAAASNSLLAAQSAAEAVSAVRVVSNRVEHVYSTLDAEIRAVGTTTAAHAIRIAELESEVEELKRRIPTANKYIALFILDLNSSVTSRVYSAFELKASTNNFAHFTTQNDLLSERLLYWSASTCITNSLYGRPLGWTESGDWAHSWDNMWVYSCDTVPGHDEEDHILDYRSWRKWGDGWDTPSFKYPRKVAVLVSREMLHRPGHEYDDDGEWLYSENDDLVWSYLRVRDGTYEEMNGKPAWTVCQPIKWLKEIPKWAYEYQNAEDRPNDVGVQTNAVENVQGE